MCTVSHRISLFMVIVHCSFWTKILTKLMLLHSYSSTVSYTAPFRALYVGDWFTLDNIRNIVRLCLPGASARDSAGRVGHTNMQITNSLVPEKCWTNLTCVFFQLILLTDISSTSCEVDLRRVQENPIYDVISQHSFRWCLDASGNKPLPEPVLTKILPCNICLISIRKLWHGVHNTLFYIFRVYL